MTVLGDKLQLKLPSAAVICSVLWSTKRASGALKTLRLLLQRSLLSHPLRAAKRASIRLAIMSLDMLEVIVAAEVSAACCSLNAVY